MATLFKVFAIKMVMEGKEKFEQIRLRICWNDATGSSNLIAPRKDSASYFACAVASADKR